MASQQGGGGEVHRADPDYRRQMIIWLLAAFVSGSILLFVLVRWLGGLSSGAAGHDPAELSIRLQQLMAGLCLLLAAGLAGLAHWLHRAAGQTLQEKRWPPKDMQTTTDVPVRYLSSAEAVARQLRLGVLAFAVLAAGTAAWALRILFL